MLKKVIAFFQPPVFPNDEERTRRARALNALHINMGSAILVLGGIGLLFFFAEKIITSIILAVSLLVTIFAMLLNRRGWVKASGMIMLFSLWIITVALAVLSAGIQSLHIIFFISGTVVAGIVLGAKGAYSYAGMSLLTGLGLVLLENAGFEFPNLFSYLPVAAWIILFINLVFTVVPLQVALQSLADSASRVRASEERYRLIASVMSDYAFSVQFGPDGEITDQWTGGAFEAITGYSPDEYIARGGWLSILHPDDREQDKRDMVQLHANQKVITEVRIARKDGEVRWVRVYAHPKWDEENNRLAGIYGAVQDITGRKRTEAELHQRAEEVSLLYRLGVALSGGENLYQALRAFVEELKQVMVLDAFHIGLYDAETDIFSYSLFLNFGEDLQPPPRKLSEKPGLTWEVISSRKTLYLEDLADPQTQREYDIIWVIEAPIHSYIGIPLFLQDRVIGIMSVQSSHVDAYTSDQIRLLETIAAQVSITIEKMGLLDQVKRELAERKRAEIDLQQREAILDVVAEAANTFLKISEWSAENWRTEVDTLLKRLGATINASHAYIFENHPSEDGALRMSMRYEWTAPGFASDLTNPKYQDIPINEDYTESWNQSVFQGNPYIGDERQIDPQDMDKLKARGIHALLDVPIYIDNKWWGTIGFDDMARSREWSNAEVGALMVAANLLGAVIKRRQMDSILLDELQQRKKLIEELENKNAELERFTYMVSHDLRSPLVTIRGFLGYLERDAKEGNMEGFRKDLERISKATTRMDNLLKDLLELSRIGRLFNEPQDVPFGDLVKDALEIVHGRLEKHGITLRIHPNLPLVHGDKPRLTEVLQNLIDNAAKYMGDQKEPVIEIGMDGYDASNLPIFFVRDNGMGIAPEYHERIFRLFDKLDAMSDGTGVGLALVKRIVEIHGGRVWVESEAGKGSTFYFTLAGTG